MRVSVTDQTCLKTKTIEVIDHEATGKACQALRVALWVPIQALADHLGVSVFELACMELGRVKWDEQTATEYERFCREWHATKKGI